MKKLSNPKAAHSIDFDATWNYILELRDEIKALRAEVELLKPNKPECGKCGEYKESYTHFSMATGMTNMHWICLNNECQE